MILTKKELQELAHGAYSHKEIDGGYLYFTHFHDEQLKYLEFNKFFHDRARFSSSVTLEFITESENMEFTYKIFEIGSYDSLDVYVDGIQVGLKTLKEIPIEGRMFFQLGRGKKEVCVYLPIDMVFAIKDFWLDGKYQPIPKRKTKVLWLGDSITQGYGAPYTSCSYVNKANRQLGYEVLNQGIGGYYYDYKVLKELPNFYPDKIIVALGINGHKNPNKKTMIENYYKKITTIYPNVPILALTPLWCGGKEVDMQGIIDTAKYIKLEGNKYSQMKVIDGFQLVPHLKEYFLEDSIHPNILGMITYADNLVKAIEKISF